MPPLGELLRRFRFLGVPGSAAAVGVPVDRRAVRAAELEPVLQALADAEAEAAAIVARAEQDAAHRRAGAGARVRSMLTDASDRAPTVRLEATAKCLTDAQASAEGVVDEARRETVALDRRAAARRSLIVDELVSRVLSTDLGPT